MYTLQPGVPAQRSLSIVGQHIFAISDSQDDLYYLIGPDARVVDETDSTVLPAFDDTHTHLMLAAQMHIDVPVHSKESWRDTGFNSPPRRQNRVWGMDLHNDELARI
ncbi:uncharacterized protein TrAtP1_003142 [Trichoderma atroviride]|uniref:uncharacterized protein n=1 Tax=Hypocrea atroviridis TaxID=63577 RepID=UPI003316C535|nr:hypothetical protein TrAtP1_003142 [Trichoderma atroviride]